MSSDEDRPDPTQIAGAPHPRQTQTLIGQDAAVADFLTAYAAGRLHSGWLITGPKGVGKATLAWKIATFLLAEPTSDANASLFGDAPAPPTSLAISPEQTDARLIQSGAHPRLYHLCRPFDEKSGKLKSEITVDPVRALKNFFHMSAADGGRRVVIVDSADELNRNAANALLKELEEPPARTTLLLIAHQPSRLLPTIRSRCRELRLSPLSPGNMSDAMAQAGVHVTESEALATLAAGSVGEGVRLAMLDGLSAYAELIKLLSGLPHIDRPAAIKLAESCAGKGSEHHFPLILDLFDHFLSRTAHAGLFGEPSTQAALGEARLLARLAPTDRAARVWANLQQDLSTRIRHGRAVNLDPAALILDMIFKIEETARDVAAA